MAAVVCEERDHRAARSERREDHLLHARVDELRRARELGDPYLELAAIHPLECLLKVLRKNGRALCETSKSSLDQSAPIAILSKHDVLQVRSNDRHRIPGWI